MWVPVRRALHAGDRATILISSYSDGTVNATVYEFDRLIPLAIVVALFMRRR